MDTAVEVEQDNNHLSVTALNKHFFSKKLGSPYLSNEVWGEIEKILPAKNLYQAYKGRPRRDARDVLAGMLWVIIQGAKWKDLPKNFPSYQTCHRRYLEWKRDGTLSRIVDIITSGNELSSTETNRESFVNHTEAVV